MNICYLVYKLLHLLHGKVCLHGQCNHPQITFFFSSSSFSSGNPDAPCNNNHATNYLLAFSKFSSSFLTLLLLTPNCIVLFSPHNSPLISHLQLYLSVAAQAQRALSPHHQRCAARHHCWSRSHHDDTLSWGDEPKTPQSFHLIPQFTIWAWWGHIKSTD